MVRLANPSTDLQIHVRMMQALFAEFDLSYSFDLHAMGRVLCTKGLISSSGAYGKVGLSRSYWIGEGEGAIPQKDSDNGVYNDCKLIVEWWRRAGWIISLNESQLNFRFTLMGKMIQEYGCEDINIVHDSFMEAMVYLPHRPRITHKEYDIGLYTGRLLASILRAALDLDHMIHMEEMMIGPCQLGYEGGDLDSKEWKIMIEKINQFRKGGELKKLTEEAKQYADLLSISFNPTAKNYMRFKTVFTDAGLMVKCNPKELGYSRGTDDASCYRLTDYGVSLAKQYAASIDYRWGTIPEFAEDPELTNALAMVALNTFWQKHGINLFEKLYEKAINHLSRKGDGRLNSILDAVKSSKFLHTPYAEISNQMLEKSKLVIPESNIKPHPFSGVKPPPPKPRKPIIKSKGEPSPKKILVPLDPNLKLPGVWDE